MNLHFSDEDERFRAELADWLEAELSGAFARVRGRGGPGDEHSLFEERHAWEKRLGEAGWIGIAWPREYGGRDLPFTQQVIFHEEYAKAGGPGRLSQVSENLLGPTLLAFGSDEQKKRFLPPIVSGDEIWAQGYSEPNAGSDLANVQTRAELEGDQWVLHGQKVWTSGGQWADWCFVLCRTEPDAPSNHAALSYLLVPMKQPGIDVRPIVQMTGTSEFSEVFYDGARTDARNIVGQRGEGWKVAMGTLAFERGASTLGQQYLFEGELAQVFEIARHNGKAKDPVVRQRLIDAWIGLKIMRYNAIRTLGNSSAELGREAMITKIYWATWHREFGKLAMDVLGAEGEIVESAPYELSRLQSMYLFTRSDTIYAGTNQIQRNIIGERALGLPREPRPPNPK
jgi:alkylation response protein AidB-like acyl-CoA dehydrogenase